MYKTFRHGGKMGDVIFSLPTIKALGGGILYLPEKTPDACNNLHSSLKDLLLQQDYIKDVREYPSGYPYLKLAPGIKIDYDLDKARNQPKKGLIHIVKRYMDEFGIVNPNWKEPWLQIDAVRSRDYSVINYTGRHIKNDQTGAVSKVDWERVVDSIKEPIVFVGLEHEYEWFCENVAIIPHLKTENILQVAEVIAGAKAVYCNQSMCLALAQAIGKTYYLDVKPGKSNCLLYTEKENLLL